MVFPIPLHGSLSCGMRCGSAPVLLIFSITRNDIFMPAQRTRGFGVFENLLSRRRAREARRLLQAAPSRHRILDIGCGQYGAFLKSVSFQEKFGVDKLPPIINNDNNVTYCQHDVARNAVLPFPKDFFDAVTLLAVIEHIGIYSARALIHEICRILKPQGVVVLTTPAVGTRHILNLLAHIRLLSSIEIKEHVYEYSRVELQHMLVDARFPKNGIAYGRFECRLNQWVRAIK